MLFVNSSLSDPFLDERDFLRLDFLALRGRWHDVVVGGFETPHDFGGLRMAFYDDGLAVHAGLEGELFAIKPHRMFLGFARGGIRPVAGVAVFRQDRLDLIVERNLVGSLGGLAGLGKYGRQHHSNNAVDAPAE